MKSLIMGFCFCLTVTAFAAGEADQFHIKWVLAHEPIGLFKEAADLFSNEVSGKTNGLVSIEVITLPDYEKKYNKGERIHRENIIKLLIENKVQMSQTYTTELGELSHPLYVLDLPFLFRDHAHAKKVLEGDIGNKLLASLTPSNIRGLAFTYSGGYRIIPGTKKIEKIEDFKGKKVRTSSSPIAQDTFNILGATAVPMSLFEIEEGFKTGKIDDAESTYARYFTLGQNHLAKIVNETNHSLFLTSIVVNEDFWKRLPAKYQDIIKKAAFHAAQVERDHSVASSDEIRKKCLAEGIQIVSFSNKEEERFKKAVKPLYKKFSPLVGADLISSIQKQ
jgi:TRAP-type C4-dicarboxylate transport system substrate-binding protein